MKQLKIAMAITGIIVISFRIVVGALLIIASYELDTYFLRLLAICSGIWIIVLAGRKIFTFIKAYKQMFAQSE
jgi:hypothetical protein